MKKLEIKVFSVIFFILSLVILSVFFITNSRGYYNQKREILSILNRATLEDKEMLDHKGNENPKEIGKLVEEPKRIFLNYTVYTVILDGDGDYVDTINHSDKTVDETSIQSIAEDIIKTHKKDTYIGNLYFTKYSYTLSKNDTLIIVDNTKLNQELTTSLCITLLWVFILEILVFLITKMLTSWIIKPVKSSFLRQQQFIADASHELKTPLAVMLASSDAFYKDGNPKWIDNMRSEVKRMTSLVTDLLDLSQIENEKNLHFKQEDISNVIESSILTTESLFYESNLKLEYKIEENIKLNCNKNQMKQLITILIDNAIKHSVDNGKVMITLKKENKDIVLEVKNKGTPIKKEEEEKIFERFYKTDSSRNRNNNTYGLGLAIAKSIVENHKGEIKASSKGGYTSFKVKWNT